MSSLEQLRERVAKCTSIVTALSNWTSNNFAAFIAGRAISHRDEAYEMTILVAGNTPVTFDANLLAVPAVPGVIIQPAPLHSFAMIPVQCIANGPGIHPAFTTPTSAIDLLLPAVPAAIIQKVPQPQLHVLRNAGAEDEDAFFQVVGYSGDNGAKIIAESTLPRHTIIPIASNLRLPFLGPIETQVMSVVVDDEQGKINQLNHHAPFDQLMRSHAITKENRLLYDKLKPLHFIYGDNFIRFFCKPENIGKLVDGEFTIDFFTFELISERINCVLRDKLDRQFMNDGLQLSPSQIKALLTLDFGTGKDQLSSKDVVKSTQTQFSLTSINQLKTNFEFFLELMAEIFHPEFVQLVAQLAVRIRDDLNPTDPQEYTAFLNSFLHAAKNPPSGMSMHVAYQWLKYNAFDTSTDNRDFRLFRENQAKERESKQAEMNNKLLQANATILQSLKAIQNAKTASGGKTFNGAKQVGQKRKQEPTLPSSAQTVDFVNRKEEYAKLCPIQVPATAKHLCPRVARDVVCNSFKAGKCSSYDHVKHDWMVQPYVDWAKNQPTYFGSKKSNKVKT